jgi:hypothetical protein
MTMDGLNDRQKRCLSVLIETFAEDEETLDLLRSRGMGYFIGLMIGAISHVRPEVREDEAVRQRLRADLEAVYPHFRARLLEFQDRRDQ